MLISSILIALYWKWLTAKAQDHHLGWKSVNTAETFLSLSSGLVRSRFMVLGSLFRCSEWVGARTTCCWKRWQNATWPLRLMATWIATLSFPCWSFSRRRGWGGYGSLAGKIPACGSGLRAGSVTGILVRQKFWSGGPKFLENWSAGPLFSDNFGPGVELWSEQKYFG